MFSMGVFCTLVVLWLLGINRGEVTRLWLFLAVFVSMVAAYGCSSRPEVPLVDLVLAASITHISRSCSTWWRSRSLDSWCWLRTATRGQRRCWR
jgi:hypothetical protein